MSVTKFSSNKGTITREANFVWDGQILMENMSTMEIELRNCSVSIKTQSHWGNCISTCVESCNKLLEAYLNREISSMTLSLSVAQFASLEDLHSWRDLWINVSFYFWNVIENTNMCPVISSSNSRYPVLRDTSMVFTEPESLIITSGGYITPIMWVAWGSTIN